MSRYLPHVLMTVAIALLLCGPALAKTPAEQPQVPADHSQASEGHTQLPAGHPQTGGTINNGPFSGSIAIKATQGTKGGPAPAGDAVRVDFYMKNKIISTQQGKLDDHGVLILENVKLMAPVQPLVTITHAQVPYRSLGGLMTADRPDQMVRVKVYETTTEAPVWQVSMRHVMIERNDKGLLVNEVLVINTPGDRTWIGSDASHTTLVIPLPANRTDTYLGPGLQDQSVKIEGRQVVDHLPLSPGDIQVQLAYIIPIRAGKASLEIAAPAAVKQMVIFTPDDGSTVIPTGVQVGQSMKMGSKAVRMYSAANLATGQKISLTYKGLPAVAPVNSGEARSGAGVSNESAGGSTAHAKPASNNSAKVIAGVGAGVLGVAVGVVLMVKKPKRHNKTTDA